MLCRILGDIAEMDGHCFFDVHLPKGNAQLFRHQAGVVVGAVRGAKARHGHCNDILSGKAQEIKRAHRHKERKRGVKPA